MLVFLRSMVIDIGERHQQDGWTRWEQVMTLFFYFLERDSCMVLYYRLDTALALPA